MEGSIVINLAGAILAFGIVFWLAGGADWVAQKTRQLELDNDIKEQNLLSGQSGDNSDHCSCCSKKAKDEYNE